MSIGNNTTYLQNLLVRINALPETSRNMDFENSFVIKNINNYENSRVKSVGSYVFRECSNLATISFPNCNSIGISAFNSCTSLTSVYFPNCSIIGGFAFQFCSNLVSISFPKCTNINNNAFWNCVNLASISFPNCTTIGAFAFAYCYSLTSGNFPKCTNIANDAFRRCFNLTSVSFPNCTDISNRAFYSCSTLSQVYLTGSSLCKLSNSDVFDSTPFTGYSSYFSGTPYIYVPESLVTSYQNATNWTYFSSYFSTIESLSGIIRFSINGGPYQAENGMTWAEWIDSKYNIDGYVADNGSVYDANFITQIWLKENTGLHLVSDTDAILSNAAYFAM